MYVSMLIALSAFASVASAAVANVPPQLEAALAAGRERRQTGNCAIPSDQNVYVFDPSCTLGSTKCVVACGAGYVGGSRTATCGADGLWANLPSCGCGTPAGPLKYDSTTCNWQKTSLGGTCNVACKSGFWPSGYETGAYITGGLQWIQPWFVAQCTVGPNGPAWVNLPSCLPNCGKPAGNLSYDTNSCNWASTPVGASCNVTCASGYSVSGATAVGYSVAKSYFKSTCVSVTDPVSGNTTSQWSNIPTCQRNCVATTNPLMANLAYDATTCNWNNVPLGAGCKVRCASGTSPSLPPATNTTSGYNGPAQWFNATCTLINDTATFTNLPSTCIPNCQRPGGNVIYDGKSCNWNSIPVWSSCNVSCASGYSPSTVTTSSYNLKTPWFKATCLPGNTWDAGLPTCVRNCNATSALPAGVYTYDKNTCNWQNIPVGGQCKVSCATGFIQVAAANATCTAGNVITNLPTCVQGCTQASLTALLSNTGAVVDTMSCPAVGAASCNVKCGSGFNGTGVTYTCNNGVWTGTPPACVGQCTAPLAPINPSIDVSGCTPRSTSSPSCTVKCAPGYIGASVPYVCAIAGMKTGWAGVPPTCTLPAALENGFAQTPLASKFLSGSTCSQYNPADVNWEAVRKALLTYFSRNGTIAPDNIPYKRVASLAVRAAFHDAGTFKNNIGGLDGSSMLNSVEQNWDDNSLPFKFLPYVRSALASVVDTYGISWADAIVMGGIAGVQAFGGKVPFNVTMGRCDDATVNPKVLPMGNLTYRDSVTYWTSVGLNITDAAALLGSHSLINSALAGGDPVAWSVSMYIAQVNGGITVTNPAASQGPFGVKWTRGTQVWKYTVNDALNSPLVLSSSCQTSTSPSLPACPFMAQFLKATSDFAGNLGKWNGAYASAYDRMTKIGAKWAPTTKQIFTSI